MAHAWVLDLQSERRGGVPALRGMHDCHVFTDQHMVCFIHHEGLVVTTQHTPSKITNVGKAHQPSVELGRKEVNVPDCQSVSYI